MHKECSGFRFKNLLKSQKENKEFLVRSESQVSAWVHLVSAPWVICNGAKVPPQKHGVHKLVLALAEKYTEKIVNNNKKRKEKEEKHVY